MNKQNTTAIILNPAARDWKAKKNWPFIEKTLRQHNINFEKFDTVADNKETVETVSQITEQGYGRIVAVGGDGTQNLIINGIMKADLAPEQRPEYALFPCGTANDIGGSFDIRMPKFSKKEIVECIQTLTRGTLYNLDLGLINNQTYFADSFGIGFDASVLEHRNRTRKERMIFRQGKQSYAPSIVNELAGNYTRPKAELIIGGKKTKTKIFNLVINNVQIYAGRFILHPDIRANDGLLDLNNYSNNQTYLSEMGTQGIEGILELIDPTKLTKKAVRMAIENSRHYQAKTIDISLSKPTTTQVDGEEYEIGDEFKVECVKHALKLVINYER